MDLENQAQLLDLKTDHDLVSFLLTCKKINQVMNSEAEEEMQRALEEQGAVAIEKAGASGLAQAYKKVKKQKKFIKKDITLSEELISQNHQIQVNYQNRLNKKKEEPQAPQQTGQL